MSVPDVLDALWREWLDAIATRTPPLRPCPTTRHGLCGMLARLCGLTRVTQKT